MIDAAASIAPRRRTQDTKVARFTRWRMLVASAATAVSLAVAGCSSPPTAQSPATPGSGTAFTGAFPGMNARGEVIDSAKVEMGHGTKVLGLEDQEGEVLGKPAPGTHFTKLKMGMDMDQAVALIGPPSDKGTRMSGTMFNPFYFGSDKYKREFVYKGMGRLVFGERGPWGGSHLIWIIHNANEPATR